MTEMFGEAWSPMSVPDLAPDDDDDTDLLNHWKITKHFLNHYTSDWGHADPHYLNSNVLLDL